jgi:negative regulator of flagellin synthesis FlgM
MADKISGYGRGLEVGNTRTRAVNRAAPENETAATGRARTPRDAVEITDTAVKLKAVEAQLAQLPDVDQARVEAIRQRIESGAYKPDPARIAQKLLRLEQQLG